jgi:hypothetical protein
MSGFVDRSDAFRRLKVGNRRILWSADSLLMVRRENRKARPVPNGSGIVFGRPFERRARRVGMKPGCAYAHWWEASILDLYDGLMVSSIRP